MDDLNIKNYIIADYDIINNGLDILLNDTEKQKISNIRGKISQKIKNNKKLKKEMESRDWESLVKILDKISLEKQYDSGLNDLWSVFKSRMYTKDKLQDLDKDLQQEILDFILELYKKNIFIMQKGELEDYYLKENFWDEFSNISGKGIVAYKIAELAPIKGIDTYIEIEEYEKILSCIL